ncbi:FUSC family protein [Streptomyces flavofungini]|uniref:FUSC family protein n=1 Tax=Streptomyces flavofungini TaxID=68200 RepID=UPI0025B0C976|nr:FUSC family protein [Streptomyces flavofungini]WJV47088.1 FUSC family protein [Streptomyces flavofungini]
MTWWRALRQTTRSGLAVERTRLEPLVALRGAAGLALVIGASLALFGPAVAASSAFGAFQAAIATFQRSWRPRPELAIASGTSLAISTFLGYLTGSHLLLFLALLALWTFLAGLSWAAGPTIGLIATSNVAIMLVTITLPTSVAAAAGHAAMMVVGGAVQAALVIVFPVRRWGAHRDALADALAAEADYARRLRHDPVAPFDPAPLMTARAAAHITPGQARTRPAELHGARGLAERIRPVLASLADPAIGAPAKGPERDRVRELLAAAGAILDAAARAIRHGTPVDLPPAAISTFRTPDTGALLKGPPHRAATRLGTLLRDVVEVAAGTSTPTPAPGQARPRADGNLVRPGLTALVPAAAKAMRADLDHRSPVTRHALRVTTVTVASYAVGTLLPLGHGYWAPMAAVMVMRPDFSQTYARAVARFGGTLVGVALATALVQLAHPGTYLSGALAAASAGLMYLLMRTGQFAAQACVAAYVVLLLGMGGEQWTQTVPERVVLTLIGGLLAMAAYALYPAWETPRLRTRLADRLAATGRYAAAVVAHYADPAGKNCPDVRTALLAARAARISWQEALARAEHEPVRHRGLSRAAAADAAQALSQLGRVAMLLEAHLPDRGTPPVPAAAALADALRTATERGAQAVRERRVPAWGPVRDVLDAWEPGDGPDRVVRRGGTLLLRALDDLSDALDTAPPPMLVDGTDAHARADPRTDARADTRTDARTDARADARTENTDGPQGPEDPTTR